MASWLTGCRVVDSRHPCLTVHGFARENYRDSIPHDIASLMESYYSLWMKVHLTTEQLQKLQRLTRNSEDVHIPLHSFMINGVRLKMFLRGRIGRYRNPRDILVLEFAFSPPIKYMIGDIAWGCDEVDTYRCWWMRHPITPKTDLSDHSDALVFRRRSELTINGYFDIHQIKWEDEDKEDFDIMPLLNWNGEQIWLIDDDKVTELHSAGKISCRSVDGWTFSITRSYYQKEKGNLWMGCIPPFLPLNVANLITEMDVRYQVNGKIRKFQGIDKCYRNDYGFKTGITTNDIQSNMKFVIKWRIVHVKLSDYGKVRISDCEANVVDHKKHL